MARLRLSFYTNIPTPYQQDFFEALTVYFDLTVVYYAVTEVDRQWTINQEKTPYQIHYLSDTIFAKWVQKRIKDYHFSWSIIRQLLGDSSEYIILSGAYWIPNTLLALLIARSRGKTVAFFGERLGKSASGQKKNLKRFSLLPVKWGCRRLLAGGKAAAESYQFYGIRFPVSIIPYNINITRFDEDTLDQQKLGELSKKYIQNDRLVLLSSGSLIPRKNMETLVRAVKKSAVSVQLLIIGDGSERNNLEQLIGTDNRIQLVGFVQADELPYYYKLADVFIFASEYDGWGVVINEAIAAGLPIISSDQVGAAQEWIRDGVNGFICPAHDENAFQQAFEKLINSPQLRVQQAQYNYNFRNKTDSAYYAQQLHKIVQFDLKR